MLLIDSLKQYQLIYNIYSAYLSHLTYLCYQYLLVCFLAHSIKYQRIPLLVLQSLTVMQKHKEKQSAGNLKNLSTQELRTLLNKLQNQHDFLQAKNEEMTNQISDLRNAVKCVQAQRKDTVAFELQRKKQLQNKVDSLQRGIKHILKNHHYEAMNGFKALME